jgi:plasmid stabilization system protein ParE
MKYRVEVSARALTEARQARDWMAREAPGRAARWYEGLLDKIETLGDQPTRCPLAPENDDFDIEIRQLLYGRRRGVYRVLFTVHEDIVTVLYVRHGAREWLGQEKQRQEDEEAS